MIYWCCTSRSCSTVDTRCCPPPTAGSGAGRGGEGAPPRMHPHSSASSCPHFAAKRRHLHVFLWSVHPAAAACRPDPLTLLQVIVHQQDMGIRRQQHAHKLQRLHVNNLLGASKVLTEPLALANVHGAEDDLEVGRGHATDVQDLQNQQFLLHGHCNAPHTHMHAAFQRELGEKIFQVRPNSGLAVRAGCRVLRYISVSFAWYHLTQPGCRQRRQHPRRLASRMRGTRLCGAC